MATPPTRWAKNCCVATVWKAAATRRDHRENDERDADDVHDEVDLDELAAEGVADLRRRAGRRSGPRLLHR
jgi:hypothetical protein